MIQQTNPHRMLAPIRLVAARREAHARSRLADAETCILRATGQRITKPLLPVDQMGRPYAKVNNPYEHTLDLVHALVERYREVEGCYPAEIALCMRRFAGYGRIFGRFYPRQTGAKPIPYIYDDTAIPDYDVLVRGPIT